MPKMKKILRSEKAHKPGSKFFAKERKRSETMHIQRAKAEPGKPRLHSVRKAIKKIRSGND